MRIIRVVVLAASVGLAVGARADEAKTKTVEIKGHTVAIADDGGVATVNSAVSPVYTVEGVAAADLIKRAQACVSKNVSFAAVNASGGTGNSFGLGSSGITTAETLSASSLIELSDPATGVLIANSRANYFGNVVIAYVVQNRMQIEAKEGRFRITSSDFQKLQKSTGSIRNSGFGPVVAVWGTGWEKALETSIGVSEKVASCMTTAATEAW